MFIIGFIVMKNGLFDSKILFLLEHNELILLHKYAQHSKLAKLMASDLI